MVWCICVSFQHIFSVVCTSGGREGVLLVVSNIYAALHPIIFFLKPRPLCQPQSLELLQTSRTDTVWRTWRNILGLPTIILYHLLSLWLFCCDCFLLLWLTEAEIEQSPLHVVRFTHASTRWKMAGLRKTIVTIGQAVSSWPVVKSHTDKVCLCAVPAPPPLPALCWKMRHVLFSFQTDGHFDLSVLQPINIFRGISAILQPRSNTAIAEAILLWISVEQVPSLHRVAPSTWKWSPPLTPQMTSQTVSSIFFCSSLPSGTFWTPGLSSPWCCLPTSSSVCLVFFPFSLCLAKWFWSRSDEGETCPYHFSLCLFTTVRNWSLCSLIVCWVLSDFLIGNMVFVWDA